MSRYHKYETKQGVPDDIVNFAAPNELEIAGQATDGFEFPECPSS